MLLKSLRNHVFRNYAIYVYVSVLLLFLVSFLVSHTGATVPGHVPVPSGYFDTENVTATRISCAYPVSGQWGLAPRVIFDVLLVLTILFRRNETLAALMVATPMLYSSIAAIHNIVVFAFGGTPNGPNHAATSIDLEVGTSSKVLSAFHGVDDLDMRVTRTVLFAGLMAAIPIKMWSLTFRNSPSKPIVDSWVFLMAVRHVFCHLYHTNALQHYQICPKGAVEPLPGKSYQAVALDAAWTQRFDDISFNRTSDEKAPSCLYSCFLPASKIREQGDIHVYEDMLPFDERTKTIIIVYGILAWISIALYVFIQAKFPRMPTLNSAIERESTLIPDEGPQLFLSRKQLKQQMVSGISRDRYCFKTKVCLRLLLWTISVTLWLSFVLFSEIVHLRDLPVSENFLAVGQWSSVANVILIFLAVLIRLLFDRFNTDADSD